MQGKKVYQEQLFNSFRLSDRVPSTNFYRLLREALNLDFLYGLTRGFYGDSGQKSIDPIVFFKLCLVGYLENIVSDRKLIEHCSMRLDVLYFIGYDIEEELPWFLPKCLLFVWKSEWLAGTLRLLIVHL